MVTMKDISVKAGVAQQTVSKILNKKDSDISQGTRERVLDIARQMNYRPNFFASTLKTGRTGCIGVATPHAPTAYFTLPYATEVYTGINEYYTGKDVKIFYPPFDKIDGSNSQLVLVESRMVDGMIILLTSDTIQIFEQELMESLQRLEIPFVCIHSLDDVRNYPAVGFNSHEAGYLAGKHLTEHGYHLEGGIGCMVERTPQPNTESMLAGLNRALEEEGSSLETDYIFKCKGIYATNGYKMTDILLAEKTDLPAALFVVGDRLAAGMQVRLAEEGIRVPDDIALLGFGNDIDQKNSLTKLSTIDAGSRKKGFESAKMLDTILNSGTDTSPLSVMQPELVIRTSCGCKS